jgi:flagella basal body P-ring formation protein FlgA
MKLRLLLSGALVCGLLAGTALAAPAKIRPQAVIDADTIRLGDLVEGLDQRGEIALFGAPAPGGRGTIRVDRILEAARELGIEDIDPAPFRAVTVIRPGKAVARAEMQELITRALAPAGGPVLIEVTLDDIVAARTVDLRRAGTIRVAQIQRDPRSGRFEARLTSADESESWLVTGSVAEFREIAVPVADLERGDAVQAKDLTLVRRPAAQVPSDIIANGAELLGLVPRRALRAGEPIRNADMAKPLLVEKNQIVTVTYAVKGLSLSMRGRALAGGAKGDTIRVQNPQSKRTIEGIVTGSQQVTITTPPPHTPHVAEAKSPAASPAQR